jgi:hypothetical protein
VGKFHLPRVLARRGVAAEESDEVPDAPAEPELEVDEETHPRVTPLELFFDLVFVFAMTQVTGFLYSAPTWTRPLEACAIPMLLWLLGAGICGSGTHLPATAHRSVSSFSSRWRRYSWYP